MITLENLRFIAGAPINKTVAEGILKFLPQACYDYGVDTPLRLAHFLAQCCHESDHFRTLQEYASGAAYEGRKDLGNTVAGDGRRYKGRGMIQLTGRANYKKIGEELDYDLINNPELALTPEVSCYTAVAFWARNNLNALADADDVTKVTKRINGGTNGLQSRKDMTVRAKQIMDKMFEGLFDNVDKSAT